ncbi:hypothetical protein BN14_10962 [Rhizoctonia solani AG-1 IB]|uniref:Methyltransferase type 11 domain-containing protein n=1 Tax=Thanatephorus cucumeris (strain AG1-IB / isolate 7/3/14) TaxID=1108050 RepID=M5CBI8_THACB|nr:hypothetical protein BN14_10962 [Rhizoctonia solani AG-1 IB]
MIEPSATPKYTWYPALYNSSAPFVYSDENTKPLFALLSARPGEQIVDMGCGTGELTQRLQELVGEEGLVMGLEVARANGVKKSFCCDIQNLVIPTEFKHLAGTFDAVFTNATLHWCKQDPHGPIRAAKTLLKPGGRFVGEFCGYMTGTGIRCAISQVLKRRGITVPDPWFLPQPMEYAEILRSEGFQVENVSLNPRVSPLPGTMVDFLRALYRVAFLNDIEDEEAEGILEEVSAICEFDQRDGAGVWSSIYATVRFRALAPM